MYRKPKSMKQIAVITAFLLLVAGATVWAAGNQEIKDPLFKDAYSALKTAEGKLAARFAPTVFEEAMKEYDKAEKDLAKGKSIEGIKKRLNKAIDKFQEASKTADQAHQLLTAAESARKDALDAEATQYAAKLWEDAEEKLDSAISSLIKGYPDNCKSWKEADMRPRKSKNWQKGPNMKQIMPSI